MAFEHSCRKKTGKKKAHEGVVHRGDGVGIAGLALAADGVFQEAKQGAVHEIIIL